jgi:hypothetical protein
VRLGFLQGPIEHILAGIASRRDKTLQWGDGKGSSLVLCGFETAAQTVNIDKPANTDQARQTIYHASLKAGFLKSVVPHDIRRGAARDTAHLRKDLGTASGLADASVAAELGHSTRALDAGITAAYVGCRGDDTWTKRIGAKFKDSFGLNTTGNCWNIMYLVHEVIHQDQRLRQRLGLWLR